jgi:hypothetical protein
MQTESFRIRGRDGPHSSRESESTEHRTAATPDHVAAVLDRHALVDADAPRVPRVADESPTSEPARQSWPRESTQDSIGGTARYFTLQSIDWRYSSPWLLSSARA